MSKGIRTGLVGLLLLIGVCLGFADEKKPAAKKPAVKAAASKKLSAKQVLTPATLGVYGGWGADPTVRPFLFSWNTRINFFGGNWKGNAKIKIHMKGPMNNLTIPPKDRILGTLFTDEFGSIFGSVENSGAYLVVPFDDNKVGNFGQNMPDIPVPGHYELYGLLDDPFDAMQASIAGGIEVLPQTDPDYGHWPRSRGLREGFLGGQSPEYLDPEWVTVWSKAPIQVYGTVADTDNQPNNQPMLISHHEAPGSHYGHDANLMVLPDPDYKWVLGVANLEGEPNDREAGRFELEWEIQNDYSPYRAQQGVVGMPLWVHATAGDRIYTVGQWVMDGGHRGEGPRTEIHPPRLLATIRKNNAVVPFGSPNNLIPAKQVDVFVSGHGGGINQYYDGLEDALSWNGGGARLEDLMDSDGGTAWEVYHRYGPGDGAVVDKISDFLDFTSNIEIFRVAGPSALGTDLNTGLPVTWNHNNPVPSNIKPWVLGPEERPINDMDYDFDVVLPPAPSAKGTPQVIIETHGEHTTAVNEVITYSEPNERTGLVTAHIHLPYKGADNGVYARTYKFYWNTYKWPGRHFKVKINEILFFLPESDLPFPFNMPWNKFTGHEVFWVNVCGQWRSLTDIKPDAFLSGAKSRPITLTDEEAPEFDVWLDNDDNMRVYAYGYDRCDMENKYANDIGKNAYDQAGSIIDSFLESGDDKKMGAAFFDRIPKPTTVVDGGLLGHHYTDGGYIANSDHFYEENYSSGYTLGFTVSEVPNPKAQVSPSSVNFGDVVLGTTVEKKIKVSNLAAKFVGVIIDTLHLTPSATGAGYSVSPDVLFGIGAGDSVDLTVKFKPEQPTAGAGSVTIDSDDPSNPTITVPMTAHVLYPELTILPVNTQLSPTVVGCTRAQTVTVKNTGTSDLIFKPVVSGAGYSVEPYGGDSNGLVTVTAGSTKTLTLDFSPGTVSRSLPGTLTFDSNDPYNPTKTLSFCGEGVRSGIRVLVVKRDGTPYATVDQMTLTKVPKAVTVLKKLPLVSVLPPSACRLIQYQLEQTLPATNPNGNPGVEYQLNVKVGNSSKSMTFTLSPCDFREIFVTLP